MAVLAGFDAFEDSVSDFEAKTPQKVQIKVGISASSSVATTLTPLQVLGFVPSLTLGLVLTWSRAMVVIH